jgi:hypothetical protein
MNIIIFEIFNNYQKFNILYAIIQNIRRTAR